MNHLLGYCAYAVAVSKGLAGLKSFAQITFIEEIFLFSLPQAVVICSSLEFLSLEMGWEMHAFCQN